MLKSQVEIGREYVVKVSGSLTRVKIKGESPYGGWEGVNVTTGRAVRIKTAGRLRRPVTEEPGFARTAPWYLVD
jgi:hypothetical protein